MKDEYDSFWVWLKDNIIEKIEESPKFFKHPVFEFMMGSFLFFCFFLLAIGMNLYAIGGLGLFFSLLMLQHSVFRRDHKKEDRLKEENSEDEDREKCIEHGV